jgi:hypothetical protein
LDKQGGGSVRFLLKLLKRKKKIAFIDGDQDLDPLLNAYETYLAGTNTETHFVRLRSTNNEPKKLRNVAFNRIYIDGTAGKECVDKFIAAYIQKAVSERYDEITVVSSDYDFIDIFKMAVVVDPTASEITFRIIIPVARGRIKELPAKVANITVVKVKEAK